MYWTMYWIRKDWNYCASGHIHELLVAFRTVFGILLEENDDGMGVCPILRGESLISLPGT